MSNIVSFFFQVLDENGLTINPAKCVFAAKSLKFLGHMVDEHGIRPLPKHVTAVQGVLPPTDVKQLQRFLGMINFYRRFLPGIARVLRPLTDLLRRFPEEPGLVAGSGDSIQGGKGGPHQGGSAFSSCSRRGRLTGGGRLGYRRRGCAPAKDR